MQSSELSACGRSWADALFSRRLSTVVLVKSLCLAVSQPQPVSTENVRGLKIMYWGV